MLNGEKVMIFGDGKQTRDFVFVEDVVRANLFVLENRPVGYYNISTGIETNITEVFQEIANQTKYKLLPEYEPPRKGEQRRSVLDYSKAKKVFGWNPEVNLRSGLEKTVEYFKGVN